MRSVILVSHGTMAKGVYQAGKMIYGNMENVSIMCLEENMGIDCFKKKLNNLIENIKDSEEIIVLADLKGGSPYTSSVTMLAEKELLNKSTILTGLNLPMLLSIMFMEEHIGEEEVNLLITASREGIEKFQVKNDEDDDL